ncbi:MAG: DUF4160 domain-containing protein [Sphingobacteriales bacterium JAD_PAG50586_3]|nr:MAG: DUF4160 domain-containing protein [Sphingobacteriales bacterium JAD_PAG50586_3]
MPKALPDNDSRGFKFRFFSNENNEPPHVHVFKGDEKLPTAKWWLVPNLKLEYNKGFKANEIRLMEQILKEKRSTIINKWNGYFNK